MHKPNGCLTRRFASIHYGFKLIWCEFQYLAHGFCVYDGFHGFRNLAISSPPPSKCLFNSSMAICVLFVQCL